MEQVDFLIAGGGGAGLGLASALLDSPLRESTLVWIDRDSKQKNDRTWCFWGPPDAPFASLARHSWQKLAVRSETSERVFDLAREGEPGWRYWMVTGLDYYQHIRDQLDHAQGVQFIQGSLESIREEGEYALVDVGGRTIAARWVFDSILRPGELNVNRQKRHLLYQRFKGWEIEANQPVFDPECATLFDFATPQKQDLRFFYVLPFSRTRALVEYTIFSGRDFAIGEAELVLRDYLHTRLGIDSYQVCSEEEGAIPMTDYPFVRQAGAHTLNIGTKGGLVKPSTGYAFQRMQQDARAIVASLLKNGHPFDIPRSPGRYRLYDTLLLQILFRQGDQMKPIFLRLFERNPIMRIFHFLNEEASLAEDVALIRTLPPAPFLSALFRTKVLGKI